MSEYEKEVSNVDILLAPHHGRKTGGNEEYLDILNPKLTIFGNAKSKHLDYDLWKNKKLEYITSNQAGNIVCKITETRLDVFVSNQNFARKINPRTFREKNIQAWYILSLYPSNFLGGMTIE